MRNTKFLSIIIIYLIFCVTVNAQSQCSFKLDTTSILNNSSLNDFRSAIENDSFTLLTNRKDIPYFIKSQLDCICNGFSIANPGKPFQGTDIISWRLKKLPPRQLTFLARSNTVMVINYQKGGFGLSKHLILVKFENKKIVDLWAGSCSREIITIEDLVSALKEEEILKPNISNF